MYRYLSNVILSATFLITTTTVELCTPSIAIAVTSPKLSCGVDGPILTHPNRTIFYLSDIFQLH